MREREKKRKERRMTDTCNLCPLSAANTNSFNPTLSSISITLSADHCAHPTPHRHTHTHNVQTHAQISKSLNQDEQY